MNRKQRFFLWLGIVMFGLMGLIPPTIVFDANAPKWMARLVYSHRGYNLIFSPYREEQIDFNRLFLQWGTLIVVVAGTVLMLGRGKSRATQALTEDDF